MNKGKSFMQREKRSGPNTEPCGIPYFMGRKSDLIVCVYKQTVLDLKEIKKLSA